MTAPSGVRRRCCAPKDTLSQRRGVLNRPGPSAHPGGGSWMPRASAGDAMSGARPGSLRHQSGVPGPSRGGALTPRSGGSDRGRTRREGRGGTGGPGCGSGGRSIVPGAGSLEAPTKAEPAAHVWRRSSSETVRSPTWRQHKGASTASRVSSGGWGHSDAVSQNEGLFFNGLRARRGIVEGRQGPGSSGCSSASLSVHQCSPRTISDLPRRNWRVEFELNEGLVVPLWCIEQHVVVLQELGY